MPSGITQIFQSKLTDVDTVQRDQLGVIRHEGNKMYKYVKIKNSATVAIVAGDILVYYAAASTGYLSNQVSVKYADGDANFCIGAGVALAACAGVAATSYYAWLQIRGHGTLSATPVGGAEGKAFIKTVNADKTATLKADDIAPVIGIQLHASDGTAILDFPM